VPTKQTRTARGLEGDSERVALFVWDLGKTHHFGGSAPHLPVLSSPMPLPVIPGHRFAGVTLPFLRAEALLPASANLRGHFVHTR